MLIYKCKGRWQLTKPTMLIPQLSLARSGWILRPEGTAGGNILLSVLACVGAWVRVRARVCVRACLGACAWGRGCACERVRLCVGACSRSLGDCSKDLHTQTAKTLKRCLPRLVTSINTYIDELVAFCPDMLKVEEDNPIIF